MRDANTCLNVHAGRIQGPLSTDAVEIEFRIEDRPSGTPVLVFRLSAEQMIKLIGGTTEAVPGWVMERNFDRLRRKASYEKFDVPREVADSYAHQDRERQEQAALAWGREHYPGAEIRVILHNYGWGGVAVTWGEVARSDWTED